MKFFPKTIAKIRRNRRIRAARSLKTSLREFVYLDEVSVYSLLASRQGALATEYTNVESTAEKSEASGGIGASAKVVKGSIGVKTDSTRTQSSQVLRKSTKQAVFKELYESEEDRLAIKPPRKDSEPPTVRSWADIEALADTQQMDGWIYDASDFERGKLAELEVELDADAVYKVTSTLSALHGIIEENPEIFSPADHPYLAELAATNRILGELLVGLIPISCKVIDYKIVSSNGRDFLVHEDLLSPAILGGDIQVVDAWIVGVTEQRLFWKDVRRVLFANSRYRIMCRLTHNSLKQSWIPVKLAKVVQALTPELSTQIDKISQTLIEGGPSSSSDGVEEFRERIRSALTDFATSLSQITVEPASFDESELADLTSDEICDSCTDLTALREAFSSISSLILRDSNQDIDPVSLAHLRVDSLLRAGVNIGGGSSIIHSPAPEVEASSNESRKLVEVEFVAIYW